jgi:hypothetical protein
MHISFFKKRRKRKIDCTLHFLHNSFAPLEMAVKGQSPEYRKYEELK